MFNIENAAVETRSFTREASKRDQNFDFKYRAKKGGHDFTLSNAYAQALGLEDATAAILPSSEGGKVTDVALVFLPDGHPAGKLFVKSKNPKFNSALLEGYLAEAGVIEVGESMVGKVQKLELELFEQTIDIDEKGNIVNGKNKVYVITSSGEEAVEEEEEEEEVEEVEE